VISVFNGLRIFFCHQITEAQNLTKKLELGYNFFGGILCFSVLVAFLLFLMGKSYEIFKRIFKESTL
jgi:hypothetical protein